MVEVMQPHTILPDIVPPHPSSLYGGGTRKRFFNAPELRGMQDQNGQGLTLVHARYDLHKYVAAHEVPNELAHQPGAFACDVPWNTLIDMLDKDELRELCGVHNIETVNLHYRETYMERMTDHCCDNECERSYTILVPTQNMPRSVRKGLLDVAGDGFLKGCRGIPAADLGDIKYEGELPNERATLKITSVSLQPCVGQVANELIIREWSLSHMVKYMSTACIRSLGALHGLEIPAEWTKDDCQWFVGNHVCQGCPPLWFKLVSGVKKKPTKPRKQESNEDFVWEAYEYGSTETYPPRPVTKKHVAQMMREFCEELKPAVVEENGCAVCGQICPTSSLSPMTEVEEYLHILETPEATRAERKSVDEPIKSQDGPVVLENKTGVCITCKGQLVRGQRPKFALANSLWLGEVPDVLKGLTFAEQTMISRVRYSRCVVRVANGHAKMTANVISFEHPTLKIYNQLPIAKSDLDEVLAVIYTGIAAPTGDDLKRTPMLVRRQRVQDALEWLKLNHAGYHDLTVDYQTLGTYPLEGVPVEVLHQKHAPDEGNVEPAAQSQFDNEDEQGTESGPCPFTVHGLTSDHYTKMTTAQRKAGALQHLKNGGSLLAVGHEAKPQSMYDNPSLYPSMFPWLFPYGFGGVGQEVHAGLISRDKHVRWLLMYHDKRFQRDAGFVIVTFNHQLIRQGTTGSFMLVRRNNFAKVADTIQRISPYLLSNIAERMKEGGKFVPQSQEEKDCFRLLNQIEYVGGQVNGSLASKKFQRNELWSLVAFKNAPHWFITLSPADNKHPLCIYLASDDEYFFPEIKDYAERQHLVTRNPVACARFFDYVVRLFIKHICGWKDDGQVHGMFGKPSAYYGTVEQQGRMTLHLHHLLWIEGSLPPQVIREKLLSDDSDFQKDLIAYLDSCRVGEFFNGSMSEVKEQVPHVPEKGNAKGIHTILTDENTVEVPPGYKNPTLTMPDSPPDTCCDEDECDEEECDGILTWWQTFTKVVDDIVFRSNVHKCFGRRDNAAVGPSSSGKASKDKSPKQHATGKGCINKDGVCTARFPRDTYENTCVDADTGHVNLKKEEEWINDVTPLISGLFRCNTDTTCILSGTAVKATLGYITDYITKGWLKTHQIFSIMYDTFTRKPHGSTVEDKKPGAAARRMVLKIVNSLSAKMEIGAPMASLYLLGLPDHYTSHDFKVFYWKNYVNFVEDEWKRYLAVADPDEVPEQVVASGNTNDVGIIRTANESQEAAEMTKRENEDNLLVQRSNKKYVGKATTDDYRHRPSQHDKVCLYEWVQCSVKQFEESTRAGNRTLQFYPYRPEHPRHESHTVACDLDRRHFIVPNFVGPAMPRCDSSEKEQYCLTMLCFFCPWRTGIDLKGAEETWEEAFDRYDFTDRQRELMRNFNLRYECYDARDDFPSMFKTARNANTGDGEDSDSDLVDHDYFEDRMGDEEEDLPMVAGPKTREMESVKDLTTQALRDAGWTVKKRDQDVSMMNLPRVVIDRNFNSTAWKGIIRSEKNKIWQAKFRAAEINERERDHTGQGLVRNDAFVVPASYISQDFVPERPEWSAIIAEITREYSLNIDQRRAFNIIANHATCVAPNQLLMHLGGMGGTGKSQVIRALESYFKARGEPYRLVLLGPTGTSAALIGGSTYHSFLGLRTGNASGESLSSLDEVLERLIRCGYIFLDETSMLSCCDMCRISARICNVLQMYEKPFGGLNVILAGDFAQLPPAKGSSLYSRSVSMRQTPRQTIGEQESTIGKMIWLQFTKVVILRQNMRQTSQAPDEQAFRKALVNLRYYNCDSDDIALIRSRIANNSNSLSVDDEPFKNVSIITARNRVKDQFNECNVQRFSTETSQHVAEFYSIDKLSQAQPKRTNEKRVYAHVNHLSTALKNILWEQPPHTSEQVPACLKICVGMPVIIRYNAATELCITRGQEARVLGWTSTNVSATDHRQVLDVLYVELVNPPKRVKLPNLPLNVVPLTKMSQSVEARLPSDEYLCISRNQVPCLPNFAMTDYSSQGKTREVNVIDIKDSKNFQAVYTCLSRGTTLAGTVIVRDFGNDLLKGTLDGEIRQEYRELDLLDAITDLQHQGELPLDFGDGTRWGSISAYRDWMRGKGHDIAWEPYIHVEHDDDQPMGNANKKLREKEKVKLTPQDIKFEIHTLAAQHKRKLGVTVPVPKKKRRVTRRTLLSNDPMVAPVGPVWDAIDHSCAYDSCVFVLYWLWFSNVRRWTGELTSYSPVSSALAMAFEEADRNDMENTMTTVTNRWRGAIRAIYPGEYPVGHEGADILELLRRFFGIRARVRNLNLVCQDCQQRRTLRNTARHTLSRYNTCGVIPSIQGWINEAIVPYGACEHCGGDLQGDGIHEELLAFDLCGRRIRPTQIEPRVTTVNGGAYRLVGVIYHGGYHFVSRIITAESRVFYHDGIHGSYSTAEGLLDEDDCSPDRLSDCGGRQPTFAIYARQ